MSITQARQLASTIVSDIRGYVDKHPAEFDKFRREQVGKGLKPGSRARSSQEGRK